MLELRFDDIDGINHAASDKFGEWGPTLEVSQETVNTFADFHASDEPDDQDLVMHAQLKTPAGLTLMASDTPSSVELVPGSSYSVSLSGDDEAELHGYWNKLSDGGAVTMPLEKAAWGDSFGMCVDKFGVNWMVNITGA